MDTDKTAVKASNKNGTLTCPRFLGEVIYSWNCIALCVAMLFFADREMGRLHT